MSAAYVTSFLDPFDATVTQPKIYDGSQSRSSGVRFRTTGNITLNAAGTDNYIVLLPGFCNPMAFKTANDITTGYTLTNPHPNHFGQVDRPNLKFVRLHSTGLKLSLLNSSDENEGYWEAVRIPYVASEMDFNANTGLLRPQFNFTLTNMANYSTYQFGKLKDIERYLFKLNSVNPAHPFKLVTSTLTHATASDEAYDMIVIKLNGRIDAVTPSMLMYNCMSNQEVVYLENTALSRLQTDNVLVRDMDVLLDKTRFQLPGVQIA